MSSTDPRERLDAFFREHIAPRAEALRARGVRFYPAGPEPGLASAWLAPAGDPEFERFDGPSDLARALAGRWRDEGLPELDGLALALGELALALEVAQDDDGDVSPFVYVMY